MQEGKYYSWEIINNTTAVKTADVSLMRYYNTGIPKEIREFWGADNMIRGEKLYLNFLHNGNTYEAYIKMDDDKYMRTSLFLHANLANDIGLNYFAWFLRKPKQYQRVRFERLGKNTYSIELFKDNDVHLKTSSNQKSIKSKKRLKLYKDGKKLEVYSFRYERNPNNRAEAIRIHGTKCMVCGFDFKEVYGELGRNYIEVHHLTSLHSLQEEVEININSDLAVVCSNCHRMIHRNKEIVIPIEELQKIVKTNKK